MPVSISITDKPSPIIQEYEGAVISIGPQGFFHTPESWSELNDWLENLSGSERAMATTAAVMAWNLAARFDAHNKAVLAKTMGLDT